MADEREQLHQQIQRYENLRALNSDAGARRVLEEMIAEARAKLAEIARADRHRGAE
jgi:hypothetical protein